MKTLTTVVLALILGLVLTAQVFAQGDRTDDLSKAISQGSSGNFKAVEVVSCDAKKNSCVMKTAQKADLKVNMTYGQYKGRFNAAKELKKGDKISGQWQEISGVYYTTFIVKD
jgi:hypothetical protein